ncbi:MAG: hypothetical protein SPF23_02880 [Paludibacteraceae bacterium]|nr:hypothetical protein [Paludibacteraceae bacterium]
MIRQIRVIIIILFILSSFQGRAGVRPSFSLDDIILDIYNAVTEFGEVDYEQLQTDLYTLHESPIDLNNTSDEELTQLYFLSPQQIDAILAYAYRHPFESLYELRLIPELADYEIRDLLPFVYINRAALNSETINTDALYAKEIFAKAHHELLTRIDARNIEAYEGTDPIYTQFRYRFDFRRRVTFGVQLRRPAGGFARDLQYGAYLQLNDITPHLHTLVAGNFQASFGQGLVLAPVFHTGKSMYVTSVGQQREGLRYYSSVDGEGLHGAGATLRWKWNKTTRLDVSALYSMRRANDSTWHHLLGANLTLRHKKLQVELTAIENLWSDSIHPYTNAKYNRHYFRGHNQAVIGASFRYNHGWFDMFGEVATAQNYQITNDQSPITKSHWGFGTIIGSRFYPTNGISLLALYRYYSPYFDNALGYAFSETSRLGDENGGYLGFDITRPRNWRFIGYGDIFYFSGYKYGLGDATRTLGYDAMAEIQYHQPGASSRQTGGAASAEKGYNPSQITNHQWLLSLRLRARAKKKGTSTYSARAIFDWQRNGWSLRTTLDANLTNQKSTITNQQSIPYGISIAQDIAYNFQLSTFNFPLSLRLRLQGFDAREWANRIYTYEHDVLYAYSIPAVYGLGGRAYLCLRWQIIPQLALYFRASETIYARKWAAAHSRPLTRTDLHLLLRATF